MKPPRAAGGAAAPGMIAREERIARRRAQRGRRVRVREPHPLARESVHARRGDLALRVVAASLQLACDSMRLGSDFGHQAVIYQIPDLKKIKISSLCFTFFLKLRGGSVTFKHLSVDMENILLSI